MEDILHRSYANHLVHRASKTTGLACYKVHVHQPVLIILPEMLLKEVFIKRRCIFQRHSGPTWTNRNPEIVFFSLRQAYTVFRKKRPLLFSCITFSQVNQFAQKFQCK